MMEPMTLLPVARTRDEAHLYMDLHPCPECAAIDVVWRHAAVLVDGGVGSAYTGDCPGCGRTREFVFGLPDREWVTGDFPNFGGPEPSRLLDAGEWLWIAERAAGNAAPPDERRALTLAARAVAEVLKFLPEGEDQVPDAAFWTDRGRAIRAAEPGRFTRGRLDVVRDTYAELAARAG